MHAHGEGRGGHVDDARVFQFLLRGRDPLARGELVEHEGVRQRVSPHFGELAPNGRLHALLEGPGGGKDAAELRLGLLKALHARLDQLVFDCPDRLGVLGACVEHPDLAVGNDHLDIRKLLLLEGKACSGKREPLVPEKGRDLLGTHGGFLLVVLARRACLLGLALAFLGGRVRPLGLRNSLGIRLGLLGVIGPCLAWAQRAVGSDGAGPHPHGQDACEQKRASLQEKNGSVHLQRLPN